MADKTTEKAVETATPETTAEAPEVTELSAVDAGRTETSTEAETVTVAKPEAKANPKTWTSEEIKALATEFGADIALATVAAGGTRDDAQKAYVAALQSENESLTALVAELTADKEQQGVTGVKFADAEGGRKPKPAGKAALSDRIGPARAAYAAGLKFAAPKIVNTTKEQE